MGWDGATPCSFYACTPRHIPSCASQADGDNQRTVLAMNVIVFICCMSLLVILPAAFFIYNYPCACLSACIKLAPKDGMDAGVKENADVKQGDGADVDEEDDEKMLARDPSMKDAYPMHIRKDHNYHKEYHSRYRSVQYGTTSIA